MSRLNLTHRFMVSDHNADRMARGELPIPSLSGLPDAEPARIRQERRSELSVGGKLAMLKMRGGELCNAVAVALRQREGISANLSMDDHREVARMGWASSMPPHGFHRLNQIGRMQAMWLAAELAHELEVHVLTYGQNGSDKTVRCSCGAFSASIWKGKANADLTLTRQASTHLDRHRSA